jgi:hypothetical protein
MVAEAPDRRRGRLAGAAAMAVLLAGLTLLLEPASRRGTAAALLALGLVVGAVAAMRLPASGRLRTPMERLNDAAFLVVVAAVALIAVRLARPLTAALPGLVGGALIGLALRPRPAPGDVPDPRPGDERDPRLGDVRDPGREVDPGRPPGHRDPDPGRAGPPPADSGAPEPGG